MAADESDIIIDLVFPLTQFMHLNTAQDAYVCEHNKSGRLLVPFILRHILNSSLSSSVSLGMACMLTNAILSTYHTRVKKQ